ncbi:cytochrome c [Rubrolithibacter danxiaensis]|uniref:cytochrome c n=1 Tax=Rubrolithibacter danxiaensis TaxID=3390805 RepID=UPI003BF8741F
MKKVVFFCCALVGIFKFCYAQKVTFTKDIAPIIHTKCTPCHRRGEAAPFSLITYEDVAKRASFIKKVTQSGYMPPWKPDNHYNSYQNDRSLTPDQVNKIAKWVDAKMPKGPGGKDEDKILSNYIPGTQYSRKPDLVLKTTKPFLVKGDNQERFVVFKIPFELAGEVPIEAIEFISNEKKIIHHANFGFYPVPDKSIDIHNTVDHINLTDEDRSQYRQYLPYKRQMTYYGGWIPGTSYESYPKDFGWVLPQRGVLLLTIHYAPVGKDFEEISGVNIFYKNKPVTRKVNVISLGSAGIGEKQITPDFIIMPDSVSKFQLKITTPQDQSLMYIWPHMHLLGKEFKSYAVTPAGDTIKLIHIPSWDFRWQEIYKFKKLVKIPKGSVLTIEGTYDNTSDNPNNPHNPPQMVFSSNDMKSTDEMMTMIMIFMPYKEGDENIELD